MALIDEKGFSGTKNRRGPLSSAGEKATEFGVKAPGRAVAFAEWLGSQVIDKGIFGGTLGNEEERKKQIESLKEAWNKDGMGWVIDGSLFLASLTGYISGGAIEVIHSGAIGVAETADMADRILYRGLLKKLFKEVLEGERAPFKRLEIPENITTGDKQLVLDFDNLAPGTEETPTQGDALRAELEAAGEKGNKPQIVSEFMYNWIKSKFENAGLEFDPAKDPLATVIWEKTRRIFYHAFLDNSLASEKVPGAVESKQTWIPPVAMPSNNYLLFEKKPLDLIKMTTTNLWRRARRQIRNANAEEPGGNKVPEKLEISTEGFAGRAADRYPKFAGGYKDINMEGVQALVDQAAEELLTAEGEINKDFDLRSKFFQEVLPVIWANNPHLINNFGPLDPVTGYPDFKQVNLDLDVARGIMQRIVRSPRDSAVMRQKFEEFAPSGEDSEGNLKQLEMDLGRWIAGNSILTVLWRVFRQAADRENKLGDLVETENAQLESAYKYFETAQFPTTEKKDLQPLINYKYMQFAGNKNRKKITDILRFIDEFEMDKDKMKPKDDVPQLDPEARLRGLAGIEQSLSPDNFGQVVSNLADKFMAFKKTIDKLPSDPIGIKEAAQNDFNKALAVFRLAYQKIILDGLKGTEKGKNYLELMQQWLSAEFDEDNPMFTLLGPDNRTRTPDVDKEAILARILEESSASSGRGGFYRGRGSSLGSLDVIVALPGFKDYLKTQRTTLGAEVPQEADIATMNRDQVEVALESVKKLGDLVSLSNAIEPPKDTNESFKQRDRLSSLQSLLNQRLNSLSRRRIEPLTSPGGVLNPLKSSLEGTDSPMSDENKEAFLRLIEEIFELQNSLNTIAQGGSARSSDVNTELVELESRMSFTGDGGVGDSDMVKRVKEINDFEDDNPIKQNLRNLLNAIKNRMSKVKNKLRVDSGDTYDVRLEALERQLDRMINNEFDR